MTARAIDSLRPASAKPPARLFKLIAYVTAATTFALMIVGGVVRVSDSGLGCGPAGSGTEGWPLCGGRLIPGVDTHMIVEYTHRILVAGATGLLVALILMSFLYFRDRPWILRIGLIAFVAIAAQAVLGALTVENGLSPALVAAHLGLAMLTLALLLVLCRLAQQLVSGKPASSHVATRSIRALSIAALVVVLGTIVAGGYMSAGDLQGTTPSQAKTEAIDAHEACGKQFPTCNDAFLPFGDSKPVNIHLAHRAFMYVASILIVALFVLVLRRRRDLDAELGRELTRWSSIVLVVLAAQVLLGALNVWTGEHEWLIVLHLAAGTLLWASLVILSERALGVTLPVSSSSRRDSPVEAVTA